MSEVLKICRDGIYIEIPPDNVEVMEQAKSFMEYLIEQKEEEVSESVKCLAKSLRVWEADLSAVEVESVLEFLEDKGLLSEEGEEVKHKFWKIFVKEVSEGG